ncbi:MAG: SIS domain-containing protein [bacterium]|nr:SIS domain-containing protein [bacterium]
MAPEMKAQIQEYLQGHTAALAGVADLASTLCEAGKLAARILQQGGSIWLAGNGGSAADALHIAGEMEGRFLVERPARPVHTLGANVSTLTAVANDYGFDRIFARQIEGWVGPEDLVWLFSTSGKSPNLLAAAEAARSKGSCVLGFLGKRGGPLKDLCDLSLVVPSDFTPWIQEAHITMGHIICQQVDQLLETSG